VARARWRHFCRDYGRGFGKAYGEEGEWLRAWWRRSDGTEQQRARWRRAQAWRRREASGWLHDVAPRRRRGAPAAVRAQLAGGGCWWRAARSRRARRGTAASRAQAAAKLRMRTLLWALRALPPPAVTLAAAAARAPATWFPLTCDRGVVRASRDRTVGWARLRSVREGDESAVVPAATAPRARVARPSEPRRVTYRYGAQLPARHAAAVCVRTSAAAVRAYALARRGAAWLLRWSCHALAAACV
jgi:hypothetical protein